VEHVWDTTAILRFKVFQLVLHRYIIDYTINVDNLYIYYNDKYLSTNWGFK